MAYTFKYRLKEAPEARGDGSGCINHDICVIVSEDGDTWTEMNERHKTVSVPFDGLNNALAQSTIPLRITAYKNMLIGSLNTQPVSITGWAEQQLQAFMEANDEAEATGAAANAFILSVAPGGEYPVDFAV
jgi:hypothetical protein